jgi:hypothetical protein
MKIKQNLKIVHKVVQKKDKFFDDYKCPNCGSILLFDPDNMEEWCSGINMQGDFICINESCFLYYNRIDDDNDSKERIN